MTDSPDSQPTRHDSRSTVTVQEAAKLLDTTVDAVRARIRRGTLEGFKVENTWRVYVPAEEMVQSEASEPTVDQQSETVADSHASDALVEHLQGEVIYLRDRLEEAERERERVLQRMADERERFDVIHRTALDRIEALAARVEAPESPESDETDDQMESHQREESEPTAGAWARLARWWKGER